MSGLTRLLLYSTVWSVLILAWLLIVVGVKMVSALTRRMAVLHTQANGNAAVAVLDDADRSFLEAAVQAYTSSNKVSVAKLAKTIGVGRTYFYNLIKGNSIELSRLEHLQKVLNVSILEDSQISSYLRKEEARLSGRLEDFDWVSNCIPVEVEAFYLIKYLLPAIEAESEFLSALDGLRPNSNVFEINAYEPQTFLLGKICQFVRTSILNVDPNIEGDVESGFYENDEPLKFTIPITTSSGIWMDVKKAVSEAIFYSHESSNQESYFIDFDETDLTIEKMQYLLIEKSTVYIDGDMKDKALASEVECLQSRIDRERMMKSHNDFNRQLDLATSRIEEAEKKISEYCSKKVRHPRRHSYYPLELEELASNLDGGTFQGVIRAGSREAITSLDPEILKLIKNEAFAASRGWKPSMGIDTLDKYLKDP